MIYNRNNFSIHSLCPNEMRYYLNGIHVTPEFTEVTNGHYLVRVTRPDVAIEDYPKVEGYNAIDPKKDFEFILPKDTAKDIEKNIPTKRNSRYLSILQNAIVTDQTEGENIGFVSTDMETVKPSVTKGLEGRFPRTDKIWPTEEPVLELGFNPEYMAKLCQQFKKMNIRYVHVKFHGSKSAMELSGESLETGQKVRALLMPMQK